MKLLPNFILHKPITDIFRENFPSNIHPQLSLSMFSTFKYMSLIEDRYCRPLLQVREFGILQFTRCPSPPASYITSQKTFQATYTPSYRCRCFLHSNTCH